MKIPLAPWKYRYHHLRPILAQPFFWLLFLLGPVLGIFRVDMMAQRMIFMEKPYPFEFQYLLWLPIVFYGGVILIGMVSFLWGRLFCGWSCPHNTMTEWTRPFRAAIGRDKNPLPVARFFQKFPAAKSTFNVLSLPLAIGITFVMACLLSFYIVPPEWVMMQYASGKPHISLIFGHFLFTLIGLFLLYAGHDFCRTCCPYGMGQSLSAYQEGKWRPMEIRYSGAPLKEITRQENVSQQNGLPENISIISDDCNTCQACQTICPVDIDPRQPENLNVGQFKGCFNCGECIDACKTIQSYKDRDGLLSFEMPWQIIKKRKRRETRLKEKEAVILPLSR